MFTARIKSSIDNTAGKKVVRTHWIGPIDGVAGISDEMMDLLKPEAKIGDLLKLSGVIVEIKDHLETGVWTVILKSGTIFIERAVNCPFCGEFDEGKPLVRFAFKGDIIGEREWHEIHKCPQCHTQYEYINGD